MRKWWQKLTRGNDQRSDYWYYEDEIVDYSWLKRSAIALLLFVCLYFCRLSNTEAGTFIIDGTRQILTVETDTSVLKQAIFPYLPPSLAALTAKEFVTVFRPVDPFQYMVFPVTGKLTVAFGSTGKLPSNGLPVAKVNGQSVSQGIVITANSGSLVRAAAQGKVKEIRESFGKTQVIITHGQDIETLYQGIEGVLVAPQEFVSQGQVLGRLAKQEKNEGALYFEVRVKGQPSDPLERLTEKVQ